MPESNLRPDGGWNTRYVKVFHLHSVHFNGTMTYENWQLYKEKKLRNFYEDALAYLEAVVHDVHGHRFIITVRVDGSGAADWVVDDVALTELVMEWEHKNLSILPEFDGAGKRATTEQICRVLYGKIADAFPELASCVVTVQETEDVSASYPARW